MKLISWNVNGIRACVQKGFLEFFREADADIFCLQETKLQAGQIELDLEGYEQYWNYAVKKGYSVLELCREKRVFRNGCIYKKETIKCDLWNRNRGARSGRSCDYTGI